ncbi:bifunctional metallophosphatase/5'-nucleotidase [Macrococcus hajekii]|uniref:Bifunctional metallophosphatase/5'-nucleotidase n=2 Tax=Macrococcus hajekii TaxID=198482 RepID=A0A4V3BEC3_9STAP|nr:bifunctional metallophosphatase/5'-nucleotidase [Macrococcus hajekii]
MMIAMVLSAQSVSAAEHPHGKAKAHGKPAKFNTSKEISILHTNDIHGRLEAEPGRVIGMAKVKTVKDMEQPTLMFDSGDAFQGLPISNYSKGEDMAEAMNAVGYDAMTVGNHEFDFGFDQAMRYKELLNFPILSSNIYKDGKPVYQPSTIIKKDGIRFGVIGVTTPETATKTHPNNIAGVTFRDPLPSVLAEMRRLKGHVDTFIILSHLGIDPATKEIWRSSYLTDQLAKNKAFHKETIIVLDGHSHSVIENGIVKDNTVLAQTGTALANIGKLTYTLDGSVKKAEMITEAETANLTGDPAITSIVQNAKANFDKLTSQVVFHNPVNLNGERDYVRTRETNLGNAITDAMEAYSNTGFASQGDFAVTNGGGIRASIEGNKDVTMGDIIKVLPFGNRITQIQVSGANVKAMFEHSLSAPVIEKDGKKQLSANGGFLHASESIRVFYDLSKPAGERVYDIQVFDRNLKQFVALDMNKTYNVVTNDFTAAGGDGYSMLGGPREEGPSLDTVFANYLKTADMTKYNTTEPVRIVERQAVQSIVKAA